LFLGASLGSFASVALGGVGTLLDAVPAGAQGNSKKGLLGFQGVPVSTADTVVVPPGYTARRAGAYGKLR
jgi:hypothetical protein